MSELPDKFEAVDPVTGKVFDVNFREHKYDIGETEEYTQEQCVVASGGESHDFLLADAARALIQYGRDLERADARLQSLKSLQSGAMLCRSFLGDSLGAEYNASIHEEFEALGFCPWCEGRGHRLSTNGVDKMECREDNCVDGRLTND